MITMLWIVFWTCVVVAPAALVALFVIWWRAHRAEEYCEELRELEPMSREDWERQRHWKRYVRAAVCGRQNRKLRRRV